MGYKLLTRANLRRTKNEEKIKQKLAECKMTEQEEAKYKKRIKIEDYFAHLKGYAKRNNIYEGRISSYTGLVKLVNIFFIGQAISKLF